MHRMQNINYDRNEISLDAPYLFKRRNIRNRWWTVGTIWQKDKDYHPNHKKRVGYLLAFLAALGLGYVHGLYNSDPVDGRQYVEHMLVEEQLYAHLLGRSDGK